MLINLRTARRLALRDPLLGRIIERAVPVTHLKPRRLPPYESLVRAVIYQQLSEMMLIFKLGRPDVLPVHDLGVRKGFQIVYGKRSLPSPEHLERIGRRWAPHRTTAAWYLWRATDE